MPRKTKEEVVDKLAKNTKKVTKKDDSKTTVPKSKTSGTTKKKSTKVAAKNTTKTVTKVTDKSTKTATKDTTKKTTKKTTKASSKVASKTTSKKTTKTTNKKTSKIGTKSKSKKTDSISDIEYYDLPFRYNQTIVKILAQTPNMLFVYWDISDVDRKTYEEHYGSDFFSKTKPVLIVHNKTMDYSFELEINDFANSWYLHVNDADCKYEIELGRRTYAHLSTITDSYIYISSSNVMDAPNNHILFENFKPNVIYKNIRTGVKSKRDFSKLANYRNMQEIYNIYDLYKKIYKDELFNDISNPSSMSSSSFMESSRS